MTPSLFQENLSINIQLTVETAHYIKFILQWQTFRNKKIWSPENLKAVVNGNEPAVDRFVPLLLSFPCLRQRAREGMCLWNQVFVEWEIFAVLDGPITHTTVNLIIKTWAVDNDSAVDHNSPACFHHWAGQLNWNLLKWKMHCFRVTELKNTLNAPKVSKIHESVVEFQQEKSN